MKYHSLAISGLLTMELHALNNEGAEGNTMMTRMVDVILKGDDGVGRKHTVNAVSGDMFKHIFVEHLLGEAVQAQLPLCTGCRGFDPNRICRHFADEPPGYTKETKDSAILRDVLRTCVIDDCAGILITGDLGKSRSIARKSCVEFGWVVGRPEATTTDSYFHAKYVSEGRGTGSGQSDNLGQNIFHRPASSGQYAVVVNVDLYKIGRNDISLGEELEKGEREKRAMAVLRGLTRTFVKPTGAHRNTQNPHVVDFEGVITTSESTMPAPMVSALSGSYVEQVERIAAALNGMSGGSPLACRKFGSLGEFVEGMAGIAAEMAV